MAKYSEAHKREYKRYAKSGGKEPFGKWLIKKVTGMRAGADSRAIYKMSDVSKRNRGKKASSEKDRP